MIDFIKFEKTILIPVQAFEEEAAKATEGSNDTTSPATLLLATLSQLGLELQGELLLGGIRYLVTKEPARGLPTGYPLDARTVVIALLHDSAIATSRHPEFITYRRVSSLLHNHTEEQMIALRDDLEKERVEHEEADCEAGDDCSLKNALVRSLKAVNIILDDRTAAKEAEAAEKESALAKVLEELLPMRN